MGVVQVLIPYRLLEQLLGALTTQKHALLESPTGSGKSLAILCSVLAWQQKTKELLTLQAVAESEEKAAKAAQDTIENSDSDTEGNDSTGIKSARNAHVMYQHVRVCAQEKLLLPIRRSKRRE